VAEPTLTREGNCRFASLPASGYPPDPWALQHEVARLLAGQEVELYGPVCILFNLPPESQPIDRCECQVGSCITGLGRSRGSLVIEDYRGLVAFSLPHLGAVRDLGLTRQRLQEAAQARQETIRPYWRVALRNHRMADGNLLPQADVAVFLER
jgi:hypothetical protein